MNQFRKKGYAPYLDVFPPFKTSATTHAASPIIKQTLSFPLFLFQLAQTQTKTLVYEEKNRGLGGM
jgi:hypothetical protein